MLTPQRIRTLDIAKGLGMVLVVLGHNRAVSHDKGELFRVIFSFHMPLFFFLAGVFLQASSPLGQFAAARLQSLLKPYFSTLLALGALKLASDIAGQQDYLYKLLAYLRGVVYATGGTIAWPPLWFLPHLFVASCLTLVFLKWVTHQGLRWALVLASLAVGTHLVGSQELPWSVDLLPTTLPFLVAGYLCRKRVQGFTLSAAPCALALALFLACHGYFDYTIDWNLRVYGNLWVSTLQAACGIYLSLGLAAILAHQRHAARLLAYVGSGTLFVLLFHALVQDKTWALVATHTGNSGAASMVSWAAGVLVPLLVWEVAQKSALLSALLLAPQRAARRPCAGHAPAPHL